MNTTASDEISGYVEAVRSALTGLPDATRDELLEDLPEHLAEVLAEGTGSLVERLGTPEAYASELRATAGFVGGFPDPPPGRFAEFAEAREQLTRALSRADVAAGPLLGHEKASDFLILLRPAWWVLRGYLLAMVVASMLSVHPIGLLPRIGGSNVIALILLAGGIIVSITLGRRDFGRGFWPRYALWSGTAVLVLVALAGFAGADTSSRGDSVYSDVSNYDPNPYSNVSDVFVYDDRGNLVPGARLFDQDGNPIQLGSTTCYDESTGESSHTRSMGYPYCPASPPFGPSASVSAPAAPTQAPGGASARPSSTPSVSASPSPSVRGR